MISNQTVRSRTLLAVVFASGLVWSGTVHAANITMSGSDSTVQQSFTAGTNWTGAAAPVAGNNYFTGIRTLRTFNGAGNFTFAGDSLQIDTTGSLFIKSNSAAAIITVADLRLAGGSLVGANANDQMITGGITLNASSFITGNSGTAVFDIRSTMTGDAANSVTINGAGIVAYSTNAKTYSGNTVVNSGVVLRMGLVDAMPYGAGQGDLSVAGTYRLNGFNTSINGLSGAGVVEDFSATSATLNVGNDDDTTSFTGILRNGTGAGTLALTKSGAGTFTLGGAAANTYTGLTTVSNGTLELGKTANVNALGGSLNITAGTVKYTGTSTDAIANTGTVTVNGAAAFFDLGPSHTDTVSTVTLQGDGQINGTGTSALTSTASFEMQSGSAGAILAGGAGLNKTTSGTVTLSGANTYTGPTTITGGTLSVSSLANGGAASNLGQSTNAAANLVLGGGTLAYTGGSVSTNRNFTLTDATTSTIAVTQSSTNLTLTGASTSTTGGLTKAGPGTLSLTGSNSYTGPTTVSAGTLALASSGALSPSSNITVSGSSLQIAAGPSGRTVSNSIVLAGGTVLAVQDNVGLGGATTHDGVNVTHTFTATGADTLTIPGTVTGANVLVVGGGGGALRNGTSWGGGGGGGEVISLTGQSITSGAVTVGAGGAYNNNGQSSSFAGVTGGTADGGFKATAGITNQSLGGNSGNGLYTGGNAATTPGNGGAGDSAHGADGSGGTGGAGGAGTPVSWLGTTYGGGGGGGGSGAFGVGGVGGGGNGGISPTNGAANTGGGAGGGPSQSGGSGIVIVRYAYNPVAAAGSVTLSGAIDLQSASTLDAFGAGGLIDVTGPISTTTGAGGLTIASSNSAGGSVRLGHASNSYVGDTIINSGATLQLGATQVIPNSTGKGNVSVGGTFDLNTSSETINGLSGAGVVDTLAGGAPTLSVGDNNQTSTFGGVIKNTAGTLSLTKTGGGTLTLTGANTYAGATSVDNGKLVVNGTHTGGAGYTVANGATLGGTGTISASVNILAGGHLAPGNSIGTVNTGALTVSGVYDVELGTPGVVALPGLSDLENVTGNVTLNAGSTLNLIDNGGANSQGSLGSGRYQLVTYSGAQTGTFTNVTGLPSTYLGNVIYSGPGVAAADGILLDVLDHAEPSLAGVGLVTNTPTEFTLDFGTVDQFTVQSTALVLGNLVNSPNFTASLDLDTITEIGDDADLLAGIFSTDVTVYPNLAAGSNTSFDVEFDTSLVGSFVADYVFSFSDPNGLVNSGALGTFTLHVFGQVQLQAQEVPEPASIALWTVAGLAAGAGAMRLRRKSSRSRN